jgi:hypothetical protein
MTPRRRRWPLFVFLAGLAVLAGLGAAAYFGWFDSPLPPPDSPRYRDYAEHFQVGVAALDTGASSEMDRAATHFTAAIQAVPQEPAGWANRGLASLRGTTPSAASSDIQKAFALAPDSPEIEALVGWMDSAEGRYGDAVQHLRSAHNKRPRDFRLLYALASALKMQGGPEAAEELDRLLMKGLALQPNNLFLLRERLEAAVSRQDLDAVHEVVAKLRELCGGWKEEGKDALNKFEASAKDGLSGEAVQDSTGLKNEMQGQPGFQRDSAAAAPSLTSLKGEPVRQFVKLAPMPVDLSPPDLAVTFTAEAVGPADAPAADAAWVVRPTGVGGPAVFVGDGKQIRRLDADAEPLSFPGGDKGVPPSPAGLLPVDWNNDTLTDFLFAGAGGLRFYQQKKDGSFTDVTDQTGLDAAVLSDDYFGAWAADVDMDGDLDLVVAPRNGPPFVLRNNRDETFTAQRSPFPDVKQARAFAWVDLDHDGAPDAAFLDADGNLFVYANERAGRFRLRPAPDAVKSGVAALAVADADDDGFLDLVILGKDGVLRRLSDVDRGSSWTTAEIVRWKDKPDKLEPESALLLAADLDNNGGVDLIASGPGGSRAWLNAGGGKFVELPAAPPGRVFAAADLDGDGRIDLLALDKDQRPVRLINHGVKNYHFQEIRPTAQPRVAGSADPGNVNSFGIGGEAEVRSGFLTQKAPIAGPVVHFGLGDQNQVQVLRIVWPNGDPQVEFEETIKDSRITVMQRLNVSCPFLFTWNGEKMEFVTDILWSSPLGLYINAQKRGGLGQTVDWVKVRGDQLKPRDGRYEVRVTADLWETHYFDHVHLLAVDHPADTDMYVDERFFLTPTEPRIYLTKPARPLAHAWDDLGADVTEVVSRIDGKYLDTFGHGNFQGVTRDHYVEFDLGDDAPKAGPVYLLAHGWIHPTNSSINAALEQGTHDKPRGLVLEVPDGKGGWRVGHDNLGFPAGKNKTAVIRLDDIPGHEGLARRYRLRTNMEIYWDALKIAEGVDEKQAQQRRLAPESAELRHRGISRMTQANASSPELPDYDRLITKGQYWRDLIGYYTRYGDVRELLEKTDDRYVIMNAGDEIALSFKALDEPPSGWKRDFVWISDGWEKDGNFNTTFSKTVLPLPWHGMPSYDAPPGRLQDDPVYRRFPDDWKKYHTRYVTPDQFERGLRPPRP